MLPKLIKFLKHTEWDEDGKQSNEKKIDCCKLTRVGKVFYSLTLSLLIKQVHQHIFHFHMSEIVDQTLFHQYPQILRLQRNKLSGAILLAKDVLTIIIRKKFS